jgi:hypothetical protein
MIREAGPTGPPVRRPGREEENDSAELLPRDCYAPESGGRLFDVRRTANICGPRRVGGYGGLRRVPSILRSPGRLGGGPTSGSSKLGERTHPKLEVEHLITGDVVCAKAEIVACDN